MARDAFPETISTRWFDQRLAAGDRGREEIVRHVLDLYAEPLRVYFAGMPDRRFVEPDEAVQGFLADRLARPDFFHEWRASGLRLRRWLMNAFRFYLMEERHRRRRNGRGIPLKKQAAALQAPPEKDVDRAFLVALVRRALSTTQAGSVADGLEDHWYIFEAHFLRGRGYHDIGREFNVSARRAAVMSRTVISRFRLTILDYLDRDGVGPAEMESEILCLLKVFTP